MTPALTPAQLSTIKQWIITNNNSVFGDTAVTALNAVASPDFWVWRTSVTKAELVTSVTADGTTFNWTGDGFINRSAGERDAWKELFNGTQSVNPSLANVRQAFGDIFSGSIAPAPANRTHLLTVARRKATVVEKILATGTGTTASPATMGAEGLINMNEVILSAGAA